MSIAITYRTVYELPNAPTKIIGWDNEEYDFDFSNLGSGKWIEAGCPLLPLWTPEGIKPYQDYVWPPEESAHLRLKLEQCAANAPAYLAFGRLHGVNLAYAKLEWTNLAYAQLQEANLQEADLLRAVMPNTDLTKANLEQARLCKANLYKANLRWANLQFANLEKANLQFADLNGANLFGANLKGVSFSNPDQPLTSWQTTLEEKGKTFSKHIGEQLSVSQTMWARGLKPDQRRQVYEHHLKNPICRNVTILTSNILEVMNHGCLAIARLPIFGGGR